MAPKFFKFLEFALIAALLIAVLYSGGLFSNGNLPLPPAPRIATESGPPATPNRPTPTTPRPATPSPLPTATAALIDYQIAPGDTCIAIATKFKISIAALIEANQLDPECHIQAGDTLNVPQFAPTALTPESEP